MVVFAIQFSWKPFYHAYRWRRIRKYLEILRDNNVRVYDVMVWYHKAFIVERDGTRHEVNGVTHSLSDVKKLLNEVKARYFTTDFRRSVGNYK